MGSVTLPTSGVVYLDSAAVIYSVENHAVYAPLLDALWVSASRGDITLITSELTILESLVRPFADSDLARTEDFELVFAGEFLQTWAIEGTILRQAARLRGQRRSLRTPDAIHVATALTCGANWFISNDRALCSSVQLPFVLIEDLAK